MFVVFLTFSTNKARLQDLMEDHNAWIKEGFDQGVFLMAGALKPGRGGCIVAHQTSREDLETLINRDPFVVENVVTPDIHEIGPVKTDPRLAFLMPEA